MNGFSSISGDPEVLTADDFVRGMEQLARIPKYTGPIAVGVSPSARSRLLKAFRSDEQIPAPLFFCSVEIIEDPRLRGGQAIQIYTPAALKLYVEEIAANLPLTLLAS